MADSSTDHETNKATTLAQTPKEKATHAARVLRTLANGGKKFVRGMAMRTAYGKDWPERATPAEKTAALGWASNGGKLEIGKTTFTEDQWLAFHQRYRQSTSRKTKQQRAAGRREHGKDWWKNHSVTNPEIVAAAAELAPFVEAHAAAGIVSEDEDDRECKRARVVLDLD